MNPKLIEEITIQAKGLKLSQTSGRLRSHLQLTLRVKSEGQEVFFFLSNVSKPLWRCYHRICLYNFSVWTSDSSPEAHDDTLAKQISTLSLEINDTAIQTSKRK